MRKLPVIFLLSLCAAVAICQNPPAIQDTWSGVERIVAVGDVHGDCDQFVKVLRAAQVIDDKNDWIAGKTHLVQTGDVLDRGPDSRKAMDLLMKLEAQAAKAGGAVHALIGNHEAMVLLDDWRYVDPEEIKAFGDEKAYRQAMSAQGVYGKWIRGHNTAIMINDVLFVHAGLTPAFAEKLLTEINDKIRAELAKGEKNGLAMDEAGPLWDRNFAKGYPVEEMGKELDAVLKKYGAARMVIGHTIWTKGIITRFDGRLIRIDVGMSRTYAGGPAEGLVIEKGTYYRVTENGKLTLDVQTQPASMPVSMPARKAA